MTGNELIYKLNNLSPEERDLQVHLYIPIGEDGDMASEVKVLKEEDSPYYKGDNPWRCDLAEPGETLIFVM